MSFVFLENATIRDGKYRKLIRSHCMKGKNVGKSRLGLGSSAAITTGNTDAIQPSRGLPVIDESQLVAIKSVFNDRFATCYFPFPLDERMHDLLYRFLLHTDHVIYPREYCLPKSNYDSIIFSFLTKDEAFFHCTLTMAAGLDTMLGFSRNNSKEVFKHLGNTYRCINRNIQQNERPSDSTVAAVMSLVIFEDLQGQKKRSKLHMDALCKIVSLRGGLVQFEGNKMLLQKICRADLNHALHFGTRPHFYRDMFPRNVVESSVECHGLGENILNVMKVVGNISHGLQNVFYDMISLCYILEGRLVKFDPFAFQEILISVLYRLLHLHPLFDPVSESQNDNLYYLGLLALMSTTIFQPGRLQLLPYDLLTEKFRQALMKTSASSLIDQTTIFWILCVGGISVLGDNDNMAWLLPWIKVTSSSLGILDWPGAREKLSRYPWISVFHDVPAQKLWNRINEI